MKTILLLAAAASLSGQTPPAPTPISFCARMAERFGMTPARAEPGRAAYEARALKGLSAALFGGSATVTMMLKPPASGPIGDPARFATACSAVAKGLRCDVTGPAVFDLSVRDTTASLDAAAGEAATVTMMKNRVRCEEARAA